MYQKAEHEVLLIGDQNVGKTSILSRLLEDKFYKTSFSTVGFNFKDITIANSKICFWDSAGSMPSEKLGTHLINKFDAVIVVFDLTNKQSFENINKWLSKII